jgi:ferritin-like metal-binding protein YciE
LQNARRTVARRKRHGRQLQQAGDGRNPDENWHDFSIRVEDVSRQLELSARNSVLRPLEENAWNRFPGFIVSGSASGLLFRRVVVPARMTGPPIDRLRSSKSEQERITPMGLFSKDIKTMDDLFVHTLQDIFYAEKKIVKSLPEMIGKATNPQLKQAFQSHLGETKEHVTRLEEVFRMHGAKPQAVDCPAIDGIIEEAEAVVGEVDNKNVLDAALLAAAQAVEHYEMTRYGTLIAWAKQLGRNDCAQVLQRTLDEEKAADKKLTSIAEASVNRQAA